MAKSIKIHATAYVLAPGQTLKQYKALESKWYKKIQADDFQDIEHLDYRGYSSRFSRDYGLTKLRYAFNEPQLEFYRRAGIFLNDFKWLASSLRGLNPSMCKFIWVHHAAGWSLREIVKALDGRDKPLIKGPLPRKRLANGPKCRPPSLFWVHMALHKALLPAFEAWCKGEGASNIGVDWDFEP